MVNGSLTTVTPDSDAAIKKKKPLYAPTVQRWNKEGGNIFVDESGTWFYTTRDGVSVAYPQGFPDFKASGFVLKEADIGAFRSRSSDRTLAKRLLGITEIDGTKYVWHHVEDGRTLQLMQKEVHQKFSHRGGFSIAKITRKEGNKNENKTN